MRLARWLTAAALAAVGCSDLATPAELARPQILAVRADPPAVPAGGRAQLAVAVAGPGGFIEPASVTWSIAQTDTIDALGTVEVEGDRVVYVAPDDVGAPSVGTVEVTVNVGDGPSLIALKAVGVGLPMPTANPEITDLVIAGTSVPDGGEVEVRQSELIALDAQTDPAAEVAFAWYASVGEIELYRSAPTELDTLDEPESGLVVVVVRDGFGGVAWRSATLTIR